MSDLLPFIWTRGNRRAYNRIKEVAKGRVDSTSDITIVYGCSGSGKSELLEKICRDLAWEGPPGHYVRALSTERSYVEYDMEAAEECARSIGVIDGGDGRRAAELLDSRFEQEKLRTVSGTTLAGWLTWIARRLGQPTPDPVTLLPLHGITEKVPGRYPILLTASIKDSGSTLEVKLLQALEGEGRWRWSHSRYFHLSRILEDMPIIPLLDEADTLSRDALHSFRQLCDGARMPLVLGGTRALESRLISDPRLRPLATRVGMRIELARLTLPELRSALPDLPERVVLAIWKSAGGEFRTVCLILKALQRLRQENPGRRVGQKAVAIAAAQVLAARPVDLRDDEEDQATEGARDAISLGARGPGQQAIGETVARKIARAAG